MDHHNTASINTNGSDAAFLLYVCWLAFCPFSIPLRPASLPPKRSATKSARTMAARKPSTKRCTAVKLHRKAARPMVVEVVHVGVQLTFGVCPRWGRRRCRRDWCWVGIPPGMFALRCTRGATPRPSTTTPTPSPSTPSPFCNLCPPPERKRWAKEGKERGRKEPIWREYVSMFAKVF